MQDFRKLGVWKRAHRLTLTLYKITETFPEDEKLGLVNQIKNEAVAIGSTIARGTAFPRKEFAECLYEANGHVYHLDSLLVVAMDLEMLDSQAYQNLRAELDTIRQMLMTLINKLLQSS